MNQSPEFFKKVIDDLYDGVYFVDRQRRITYWNRGAEQITGFKAEEVIGTSCADNLLMHVNETGEALCKLGCPVAKTMQDGLFREADVFLHHASGHRVPVSIRVTPIFDYDQKMVGAVETFNNNAEKLAALEKVDELQKIALLDPLTGIGNRRYSTLEIEESISALQRARLPFGVIFIDIDDFKIINDTYGHDSGDRVLKMVANTMSSNLRAFEFVGRWGGEEFIVVSRNVDSAALEKIAERLRVLIDKSWILIDDKNVSVTVSLGATMAKRDDTLDSLLERADRNLYQSKAEGKNKTTLE